jgi:hypothetical protein
LDIHSGQKDRRHLGNGFLPGYGRRPSMNSPHQNKKPNKTDAGNGSYGISRIIDASGSPSPDPGRSPKHHSPTQ